MSEPIFFESPEAFYAWLKENHATAEEVQVGFWRAHTGKPSLTWSESVDQALCFGWIDGKRTPIDADRTALRFTPRRKGSKWSQVNLDKFEQLEAAGLVHPAGRAAWEARVVGPPRAYSPKMEVAFAEGQEEAFRANAEAWAYFETQAPSWKHRVTWWVSSAKTAEARERRLTKLIEACAEGRRLVA